MLTTDKVFGNSPAPKASTHSVDSGHPSELLEAWYQRTRAWERPNAYFNDDILEKSGVVENRLIERDKE